MGRLHRPRPQDDHPGRGARQAHLPAGRRPASRRTSARSSRAWVAGEPARGHRGRGAHARPAASRRAPATSTPRPWTPCSPPIAQAWDGEPGDVLFLREGGSGPEADLVEVLGAPLVFLGAGLPTDRIHSPNERVLLSMLHRGAEAAAHLWRELAARRTSSADGCRRRRSRRARRRSPAGRPARRRSTVSTAAAAWSSLVSNSSEPPGASHAGRLGDHPPGDVQTVRRRRPARPAPRAAGPPAASGRSRRWARTARSPAAGRPGRAAPRGSAANRSPRVTRPPTAADVAGRAGDGGGVDVGGVQRDARHGGRHRDAQRARPAAEVDDDGPGAGQGDRLLAPAARCAGAARTRPGSTAIRRPQNSAQPSTCSSGSPATRRADQDVELRRATRPRRSSSRASSSAKTQPGGTQPGDDLGAGVSKFSRARGLKPRVQAASP